MPKYEGVYDDGAGGWYFKANFGRDPLTAKKAAGDQAGVRHRNRRSPGPAGVPGPGCRWSTSQCVGCDGNDGERAPRLVPRRPRR